MNKIKIIELVAAEFANSFQPGERADVNWVTKYLYEYQQNPNPKAILTEVKQDVVWAALAINPNPSEWGITREQYESAITSVNPVYARIKEICEKFTNNEFI